MSGKIGNIVSSRRPPGFGPQFNLVQDIKDEDKNLPTLVIGYDNASKMIDGFSVLDTRSYDNGRVWWAFKKTERRSEHESVLSEFRTYAIKKALGEIKYVYIDFICYSTERVKALISFMYSPKSKFIFVTRNDSFMFIYCPEYPVVWGISLSLCEYIGISAVKVINKVVSNRFNELIRGTSFIDRELRKHIGNDTHYIPALYYILR